MHREPETVAEWAAQSPSKPSSVPVCFPVKDSNLQRSEFHDSGKPGHCVRTCSVQVSTLYLATLNSTARSHFTMRLSVLSVCPIISAAFWKLSVRIVHYGPAWQVLSWLTTFILLGTDCAGPVWSKKQSVERRHEGWRAVQWELLLLAKIGAGCGGCLVVTLDCEDLRLTLW